jgi:SAM-dependent methyltransferase/uncharacterized protein YbaR (Trm112 family)
MRTDLLSQLLCPNCGGPLTANTTSTTPGNEIEFGILTCGCSEYPIVGGIPIFKAEGRVNVMQQTTDSVSRIGPDVKNLVALLRAGQNEKALLSLLVIPKRLAGKLLALADCVPARAKAGIQILANHLWSKEQHKARKFLIDAEGEATAIDLLAFYYRGSMRSELYNHFAYLFAQPRHLAGLSLASLFPASGKPILDLACGFGHYMHYWCTSHPGQRAIGIDRNFFQLYVAKNRVAPGGDFICSEADDKLPFVSRNFSGVFCSDAFHYFLGRWQSAEEMKRLVEADGLIVLSRFGNRQVEPREGYELTVDGYFRLFDGIPTRMVSEQDLLQSYLKKLGPQFDDLSDGPRITSEKWLYLLASENRALFRNHPKFETWPHAAGRLRLNPLYQETDKDPDGNITVEFRFPSKWFEFENSACSKYMPKTALVSKEVLGAVASGTWSEDLEALVRHCVFVGMPERYL